MRDAYPRRRRANPVRDVRGTRAPRAMTASGRSPISRCPQSAIARSGARSRRAYSIPSCSGTQLSLAPQRQRHGQRDAVEVGARVARDERPAGAQRVGVLRRPGEERLGHLRVEARRVGDAPPAEGERPPEPRARDDRAPRRPTSRPGWTTPSTVTVASPTRVAEEMPGRGGEHEPGDRLGAPGGARAGRRAPPSEWPTQGAGQRVLRLDHGEDRLGERVEALRRSRERLRAAVAGQLRARSRAAPRRAPGATSRQFEAMPPRPWTSTSGGPVAADEVAEPRPGRRQRRSSKPAADPVWTPSSSGHILP